jgi:hypothetical protein
MGLHLSQAIARMLGKGLRQAGQLLPGGWVQCGGAVALLGAHWLEKCVEKEECPFEGQQKLWWLCLPAANCAFCPGQQGAMEGRSSGGSPS